MKGIIVTSNNIWANIGKAHGHYEAWVPDEDMEDYLKFTDEQKINYLKENGDFLLDDFCINDRGKIESFDEEIDD